MVFLNPAIKNSYLAIVFRSLVLNIILASSAEEMEKKSLQLPFIFIAAFSLIFMGAILLTQFQSASLVKQLKNTNTQAVQTIRVNNLVDDIINGIVVLENQSKSFITSNDTASYTNIRNTLSQFEADKQLIKKYETVSDSSKVLIEKFLSLIDRKTGPVKKINPADNRLSRDSLSAILFSESNKIIDYSIYTTALAIQLKFEKDLESGIISNELLSDKVLSLSRLLGLISLIAIAILGTIIIRTLFRHADLINQLHTANAELQAAKLQTEKAASIKEQFLSNMSHEIRTPVNSIIGFTRLLHKTSLQDKQEHFVSLIKTAGENLLNIVNDILDISKIEADMLHLEKNPFSLKELCYTTEMMFYHSISEKNLEFDCVIDEAVPETIIGDKERLNQVLMNLVNNAIKFTQEGSVKIHLSVLEKTENKILLQISVKDSGIGIKPELLETIFDRFEQGEASTTRKYGGTGLGLSIVKRLVSLQGGTIIAKSEPGSGSEFIVQIPFEVDTQFNFGTEKLDTYIKTCDVQEPVILSKLKILAAEDNEMNQMLLYYIFQQWGVKFEFADNGQQAIDLIRQNNFDLILMDIQMPVMDGYAATRYIRNELKLTTPIIAMTANVLPGEKEKCKAMGMNDYLPKPINENILHDVVFKYHNSADASSVSDNAAKFVDTDYLHSIYKGNRDFIKKLALQFSIQFPQELSSLSKAVIYHDHQAATLLAHCMKTTVLSMNKNSPLLEHLIAIENSGSGASDWEIMQYRLQLIQESSEKVKEEIDKLILDLN